MGRRTEARKAIRVLPLPKVAGGWEHDWSKYPDFIRVPMSDGSVRTYRREIEQPHPQCMESIETIRKWGYVPPDMRDAEVR